MSKLRILLVPVFAAAALAVAAPVASANQHASEPASGGFKLSVHTHSGPGLLFPTDRLSYNFVEGETFSYSSRPCGGRAPFNDLGLDFSPNYPGVDDDADGTAPVRHHVEGTITEVNGDRGTIEGTITTVLCVTENGVQTESEHTIVTEFRAKYHRVSDNEVKITGTFALSPTESTGTFAGITGRGSIQGIFTCLGHARNPDAPTCAELGEFTDFVGLRGDTSKGPGEATPGLVGTFRDSSVEAL